jgi:hypothetical protein
MIKNSFTTEDIKRIEKDSENGNYIKRSEKITHQNIEGTRKSGINFVFTQEELLEYSKCKNDTIYFIEKYCKTRNSDGEIKPIILIDYQKEIINHFQNQFIIYLTSRQITVKNL